MKLDERNPEIKKSQYGESNLLKITGFSKALATNREQVYEYIVPMVSGDIKKQQIYSDFIFSHLRNIIDTEINTNVLKYASRFITTLLLVGNPHIYEKFSKYLLPVFKEKTQETYKNRMKPVWPIQQFCQQIIFLLSEWLPIDFYDNTKPSVFARAVRQLKIVCDNFRFINIDKLIISYRILKSLKLDGNTEACVCDKCRERAEKNCYDSCFQGGETDDMKKMRQKLYMMHVKSSKMDSMWRTGFQIQIQEEMSELQLLLENRLKNYQGRGKDGSMLLYRLKEKIQILEDHLEQLKVNYQKLQEKRKKEEKPYAEENPKYDVIVTPMKKRGELDMSTADKSKSKGSSIFQDQFHFGGLKQIKSSPNIELFPLQCEFQYKGYLFFESKLALSGKVMQRFKHSLLRFDQKIYLKKSENMLVSCIALSRKDKIKIRVLFAGDQKQMAQFKVEMTNQKLNCYFDEYKYEFTIKLQGYFQPIQLCCKEGKEINRIVLPIGYLKLLEPLPDSAKSADRLTFKLFKTVKLQNRLIESYEYLVGQLCCLQNTMEKVRSTKITRLFENQKLKRRLQRRYLLMGSELVLRVVNNKTKYVEIEIFCEDNALHRSRCCELLKQLIFICSGES